MFKVLINSYACCPGMGSEQGMGWNFVYHISTFCEVFVITESEYKDVVLNAVLGGEKAYNLSAEQRNRMHFYFVSIGETESESARIRQMCWNQGNWFFYPKYAKWQEKVLDVARDIIKDNNIDIIHQLNMAGFREPGMLYKINEEREKLGKAKIPIVWGPMTGYGSIPFDFMTPGGLRFTSFSLLKNFLNFLQMIGHHRVRKMIRTSDKLIAATPEMKYGIEKFYNVKVEHMSETACEIDNDAESHDHCFTNNVFKILWVGRFISTKQLPLALNTMKKIMDLEHVEFHIVGKGFTEKETNDMKCQAIHYGVDSMCHWHGFIPNSEVHKLMRECDVFFFTSIFEATSTVILEAIQNGLPIVCFDRCGFGPIVDDSIGRKIPCKSPKHAVENFADILRDLYYHRDMLSLMSENCMVKRLTLSWNCKMNRLREIYNVLMQESKNQ